MLVKFCKFAIVGGIGAIITWGLTWLLTEHAGFWYMGSLILATMVAMISNFLFNNYWTFAVKQRDPSDADYEWFAYYHGNPIQKWWKHQIAKTIWEFIPHSSKLIDIGCGSSPIVGHYKKAIGIDKNENKIRFMREKFPNNTFVVMDDTRYFKNNMFDFALCIEVIEHCKDPENIISELSRITKPYGRVVIATPDYDRKLWHLAEKFTPYKEEHCTRFTKESLIELCKRYKLFPARFKYIAKCDLVIEFVRAE